MELNFDEAIKEINSINDLKTVVEYYGIKLSTKGNYTKAICPFHIEKTPSFSLNDEGSGAYYNCFGCEAGGNVINFIKKIDKRLGQGTKDVTLMRFYPYYPYPVKDETGE